MAFNTRILIGSPGIYRKLFTLIVLVTFYSSCHGQQAKEDVLYLKDGSIIRGQIILLQKDTAIKIECSDRNTWVFPYSSIDRISKEDVYVPGFTPREKGYYNATLLGIIIPDNNGGGFSLSTANGYRFNQYLGIGGFLSFNSYNNLIIMPAGVDIRGEVLHARITPYYVCQAGVGYCVNPTPGYKFYPGFMAHPAIGIKFNHAQSAFIMEMGYEYQVMKDTYTQYYRYDDTFIYRHISVKFGFMF